MNSISFLVELRMLLFVSSTFCYNMFVAIPCTFVNSVIVIWFREVYFNVINKTSIKITVNVNNMYRSGENVQINRVYFQISINVC